MRQKLRLAFIAALLSPSMIISALALDASAIKPHMQVVGKDGVHVGTVDKVEGDQIVLTKDDPSSGGVHHQLPVTAIDDVSQDKVTLKAQAANAKAAWTPVPKPGNDPAKQSFGLDASMR